MAIPGMYERSSGVYTGPVIARGRRAKQILFRYQMCLQSSIQFACNFLRCFTGPSADDRRYALQPPTVSSWHTHQLAYSEHAHTHVTVIENNDSTTESRYVYHTQADGVRTACRPRGSGAGVPSAFDPSCLDHLTTHNYCDD